MSGTLARFSFLGLFMLTYARLRLVQFLLPCVVQDVAYCVPCNRHVSCLHALYLPRQTGKIGPSAHSSQDSLLHYFAVATRHDCGSSDHLVCVPSCFHTSPLLSVQTWRVTKRAGNAQTRSGGCLQVSTRVRAPLQLPRHNPTGD